MVPSAPIYVVPSDELSMLIYQWLFGTNVTVVLPTFSYYENDGMDSYSIYTNICIL